MWATTFLPPRLSQTHLWWGLAGIILFGLHLLLTSVSSNFAYEIPLIAKPILFLVIIEVFAGLLYLLVVFSIRGTAQGRALLGWVIVIGAGLRISMLSSTPILEDDYYRYLWDGAVVVNGLNPYAYSPAEVLREGHNAELVQSRLGQLARESSPVLERVNHPGLRSIYPPLAQATFALAHLLNPWGILAWRWVLLLFDIATLGLLIAILTMLKLPLLWLVIYWWNPLLVKEVFNSAHMDVIVLPFVLGSVLLTIRGKHLWAVGSLALAVGVKIWPIVLLPLLLCPTFRDPKRLILAMGLFSLLVSAMFYPIYIAGLDSSSGFMAYGQHWEMNDALFMFFVWGTQFFTKFIGIGPGQCQLVARLIVMMILCAWIVWIVRQGVRGGADLCEKCLMTIAMMFLLSPAQFPWYYLWVVPFLVIRPRLSLLLLTGLLPLYYLRFYFNARDNVGLFDYGIVWLEYIPVWGLLIWECHVNRKGHSILRWEVSA